MSAPISPDPDCITTDCASRDMFLFAIDWQHDDRNWTVQIWAYDWDDAEARIASMRKSLTVFGQVYQAGSAPDYIAQQKAVH